MGVGWGKNEGQRAVGLKGWIGPVFTAVFTLHARQTGQELGKQSRRQARNGQGCSPHWIFLMCVSVGGELFDCSTRTLGIRREKGTDGK